MRFCGQESHSQRSLFQLEIQSDVLLRRTIFQSLFLCERELKGHRTQCGNHRISHKKKIREIDVFTKDDTGKPCIVRF